MGITKPNKTNKKYFTMEQIKEYYNNFLSHLKKDHKRVNFRHVKIKQDLKQIIKKGFDVLDLGCGTGITTKYIAELGANVIGIDIASNLIKFAKENSLHPNIQYIIQDITELLNPNKEYNVICLIDIMEHIPRKRIGFLFENLKLSSKNITTIYLNIPYGKYQEYIEKEYPLKLQIVDEAYSIQEILNRFKNIDFEPVKIDIYGIDCGIQYISFVFIKKIQLLRFYKI